MEPQSSGHFWSERFRPSRRAAREVQVAQHAQPTIIATGGGKGGIGKSLISSNVAVQLGALGKRVILLDADLGGANLHTVLGLSLPRTTLSDFIGERVETLGELVVDTGYQNVGLISGALDVLSAANPKYSEKMRLMTGLTKLDADVVIIDLGAGTGFHILDFFLMADHGILATLPEPTSIENVYRFIKAACYRRLQALEIEFNLGSLVKEALSARHERGLRSPADLLRQVHSQDPSVAAKLRYELDQLDLGLVVNQARTPDELKLGNAICEATRKYLGVKLRFLGAVPYDDAVWKAVRHRRPVTAEAPESQAAAHLRKIVMALEAGA